MFSAVSPRKLNVYVLVAPPVMSDAVTATASEESANPVHPWRRKGCGKMG